MSEYGGKLSASNVRQVRVARSWRQRDRLFRAVFVVLQTAFLGTTMLVVPAGVVLAAAPSANLDQCANDPAPSSPANGCATSASDWVNGNLNASQVGLPRGRLDPVPADVRQPRHVGHRTPSPSSGTRPRAASTRSTTSTTWNRTVLDANPCLGVSGCTLAAHDDFPIPADPQVTGAGVTPSRRQLHHVRRHDHRRRAPTPTRTAPGFTGDKSAQHRDHLHVDRREPRPRLGRPHRLARRTGATNNSAVAISGSPYHTRLLDLDGSGGNQDRSLIGRRGHLPGLDHDHQAGHAGGLDVLRLHGRPRPAVELQPGR